MYNGREESAARAYALKGRRSRAPFEDCRAKPRRSMASGRSAVSRPKRFERIQDRCDVGRDYQNIMANPFLWRTPIAATGRTERGTRRQGSDATREIATRRSQEMEGIEYTASRSLSNHTKPKPGGFRATQQSLITP